MNILDLDATTLGTLIKEGKITSSAATETYIQHIARINPFLNCLVQDRFAEARREAKQCDERLSSAEYKQHPEKFGPLFGVPISMKDSFDVKGMATTSGLIGRKEHQAEEDAYVVQQLKQAGALILGKTNTPQLCFCQETDNKLYGKTNNPWKLSHTPGGSSGGEGALIAVGGAAVGIGSDIGGSIRFPAHFNGVIGFKSGAQDISETGHFPKTEFDLQGAMLGIGAIAKSVQDAELIHSILTKRNRSEHITGKRDSVGTDISTAYEVLIPKPHPAYPMGQETTNLLEQVHETLGNAGYQVNEQRESANAYPPSFQKLARLWQLVMSFDGAEGIKRLALTNKESLILEYLKEKVSGKSSYHRYLLWALIGAKLFKPSRHQLEQLRSEIDAAKQEAADFLQNRVWIIPVYHSGAPAYGKMYQEIFSPKKTYQRYLPYIAFANLLGLPALTVPVGEDKEGLPLSVQLVTLNGHEQALFYFGKVLERHLRGYVRCTTYDGSSG